MSAAMILLIVVVVAIAWLWITYNGLVSARLRTDEAWSDINVQLKRRYDLIPNLVNTVKGYAKHESTVLDNVTKARAAALEARGVGQKAMAENQLAETLKSLFAVSEAYPELKADQNYRHLQEELVDTEDKIQAARRFYNGNVRDFNIKLQVFPTNMIARMLGFTHRDFFEVENQAQVDKPVEVSF